MIAKVLGHGLAVVGHVSIGLCFGFFHLANAPFEKAKKYTLYGIALGFFGFACAFASLSMIPLLMFTVLRVLKIPSANLLLWFHEDVHYSQFEFGYLVALVLLTIVAAFFGETEEKVNYLQHLYEPLVITMLVVFFVAFVACVLYTFLSTYRSSDQSPPVCSVYNWALPTGMILFHTVCDILLKFWTDAWSQGKSNLMVWTVGCIVTIFALFTNIYLWKEMYSRLVPETTIPYHTCGLIVMPNIAAVFILGEKLIYPKTFLSIIAVLALMIGAWFIILGGRREKSSSEEQSPEQVTANPTNL